MAESEQDPVANTVAASLAGDTGDAGTPDTPPETKGTDAAAWYSKYPESERKNLARYKDADAAILGLSEAAKLVGKSIQIPAADAPAEVLADFYKKLGRPESKDGYDLKVELEGGVKPPDGEASWFKTVALEAGLRPEQARLLYKRSLETATAAMKKRQEEAVKRTTEGKAAVAAYVGQSGQDMPTATNLVNRVIARFIPEQARGSYQKQSESDPALYAALHTIGRAMSEDTLEGGASGSRKKSPTGFIYENSPELYTK